VGYLEKEMELLEISLDKNNLFKFDIDIRNDAGIETEPHVKFVASFSNMDLVFEMEKIKGTLYEASIPSLLGHINEGEIDCRVEVIVGDRYFIPWQSKGNVIKTLQVEAKRILKKKNRKNIVEVTAKQIPKKKNVRKRKLKNETYQIVDKDGSIIEII